MTKQVMTKQNLEKLAAKSFDQITLKSIYRQQNLD